MSRLEKPFFTRPDVVQVAKDLLGKYLVTNFEGEKTVGIITETEAYRGPDDRACHAFDNRRTPRTEVMFAEGGHAYVYLCYGIHHLFNVVTAGVEMPHAVLVRAVAPVENIERMLQRRKLKSPGRQWTGGPGVLAQALGIRTEHSGLSLLAPDSPIWLEDRGLVFAEGEITASPRVGVESAGECAAWPWRFRPSVRQFAVRQSAVRDKLLSPD